MAMLPVKIQEFGLNKATGLRKGAVEGVVLVSDSPRVSNMVYMVSSTVDLSLAGTKQAQEKNRYRVYCIGLYVFIWINLFWDVIEFLNVVSKSYEAVKADHWSTVATMFFKKSVTYQI